MIYAQHYAAAQYAQHPVGQCVRIKHHAEIRACPVRFWTKGSWTDNGRPIWSQFTGHVYVRILEDGGYECTFGPGAWPWQRCYDRGPVKVRHPHHAGRAGAGTA